MLKDVLYIDEHTSCHNYVSDYRCYFRYYTFTEDEPVAAPVNDFNRVIFVLEGELKGDFNEFDNRHFTAGDIFYLTKNSSVDIKWHTAVRLLVCMFEVPHNVCDKMDLHTYAPLCSKVDYSMQPIRILPQMDHFLDNLVYLLRNGINCMHFHELKQNEMFLIFRWFYPKEELAQLFCPMIGKSLDFREVVLSHYTNVRGVQDLANLLHMGRSSFDAQFKDEFGMPPGQWLLKQKANRVRHFMSDPAVTISDVMLKYEFNSPTHFTRFCKQQFGCTPSELKSRLRQRDINVLDD